MLEANSKSLLIITVYRILDSNTLGILKSKAQNDRKSGVVWTTSECRKRHRNESTKEKTENINDVIINRDFNQDTNARISVIE